MHRKRLGAVAVVVFVLAGTLTTGPNAIANHADTYGIAVGEALQGAPGESMRFFPEDLTVHKGDTLKFLGGFHTATMLPASVGDTEADLDAYIEENAGDFGDPLHLVQSNPDNPAAPFKLNGDDPFSPGPCGLPDNPCSYGGSEVVDSGLLFNYVEFTGPTDPPVFHGFNAVVDANPGDSFWVFCRVHPEMRMKVTVVLPNETTSTQEEIDAAKAATIESDSATGRALHESLLTRRRSRRLPSGAREWQAYAGYDTEDISLFRMYPRRLTIKRGDRVRWHFDQLHHETHTVTHPLNRGLQILNNEPLVCDSNGDAAGGETPPDFSQGFPPACPEGSVLQALITNTFALPQGDGVVQGPRSFENSGMRGVLEAPGAESDLYRLRFPKRSGRTPYKYLCMLHPEMRGRITVTRR